MLSLYHCSKERTTNQSLSLVFHYPICSYHLEPTTYIKQIQSSDDSLELELFVLFFCLICLASCIMSVMIKSQYPLISFFHSKGTSPLYSRPCTWGKDPSFVWVLSSKYHSEEAGFKAFVEFTIHQEASTYLKRLMFYFSCFYIWNIKSNKHIAAAPNCYTCFPPGPWIWEGYEGNSY